MEVDLDLPDLMKDVGYGSLTLQKFTAFTLKSLCTVEDTSILPRNNVLDQNTHDRGIGKTPSDKEDEMDAKLVGAHATYARGLTPWHAGGMIT